MEVCRKEKPNPAVSNGEMRWPDWIQSMQDNSRLLGELLEAAEWSSLQEAIRHREKLLREAVEQLGLAARNRPGSSKSEDQSDIKTALQAALETNRELMGELQTRRTDLKAKIGDMSKGRKLLKLYKTNRQAAPRFFDRFG